MTNEQAVALVKAALHEISPAKAAELETLGLDTRIRDAGIDSVAAMEMVGVIEERLEVTFPDEDLAQLNRFSDIVDLITSVAH
ncbi:MAG: acyl carrier protein [Myxococcales bacterium]|nr:acyl carrier protein [Myxococcales bacterium]MCB9530924.1 acyl carrier protein [Myxococcales bacterium]MCB9534526.1 acyl carrier protein [Myxococcales bacterium]